MSNQEDEKFSKEHPIIREIIELERRYFFEKPGVNTQRAQELQKIIERHTKPGDVTNDS